MVAGALVEGSGSRAGHAPVFLLGNVSSFLLVLQMSSATETASSRVSFSLPRRWRTVVNKQLAPTLSSLRRKALKQVSLLKRHIFGQRSGC